MWGRGWKVLQQAWPRARQPPPRFVSIAIPVLASSFAFAKCESPKGISIDQLLELYQDVDVNMHILGDKLLQELDANVAELAKTHSKEQIALYMSEKFETLLARVQDSVFRNHGLEAVQVKQAIQAVLLHQMENLSETQVDALNSYSDRLARLRWTCTGYREPIGGASPLVMIMSPEKIIPLVKLTSFLESIFDQVNTRMEELSKELQLSSSCTREQRQQQLMQRYFEIHGEVTEETAVAFGIDLHNLQQNLHFYENHQEYLEMLEKLTMLHQEK